MILTIAIPTYNRSELLKRQLIRILSCMSDGLNVEILISDNASEDDTYKISQDIIKENAGFLVSYYRNDSNLGFDLNVDNAIRKAKGEYVWILSDDDSFVDSAISAVYKSVVENHGSFSVGFINYRIISSGKEYGSSCTFDSMKESFTCDKEDFFVFTGLASSFVSANIFRRNDWLNFDCTLYENLLWIHLFAVRDILARNAENKALIIPAPLIFQLQPQLNQSRKKSSVDKIYNIDLYLAAHVYIGKFCENVIDFGYSESLRKELVSLHKKDDSIQVVTYKISSYRKNIFSDIRFFKLYLSLDRNICEKMKVLFLMLCPSSFYKITRYIKNNLGGKAR